MKNLVIIGSVINISNNPLSYTKTRSVYNYDERLEQTMKTIDSLTKINDKHVVLVETSELKSEDEELIKSEVDFYFNFKDDQTVKNIIDGTHKGSGEAAQLLGAIRNFNLSDYENIIKISGRYWLNDDFNYNSFDNNNTMFKESHTKTSLSTVIYKINNKDFKKYEETLSNIIKSNQMMETVFLHAFKNTYTPFETMGIMGNVSVDGVLWQI